MAFNMDSMFGEFSGYDNICGAGDTPEGTPTQLQLPAVEEKLSDVISDNKTEFCRELVQKLDSTAIQVAEMDATLMTEAQRQECESLIGWSPQSIVDGPFNACLSKRYAQFNPALRTPLLRPAVESINTATQRISASLMLIVYSRKLVSDALHQMGQTAQGRGDLVDCAMHMDKQIEQLGHQVDHFVKTMGLLSREVGAAATMLEYGTSVSVVKECLTNVSTVIKREAGKVTVLPVEVKKPIDNVKKFALENLDDKDDYERRLRELNEDWKIKQIAYSEKREAVERLKEAHKSEISRANVVISTKTVELAPLKNESNSLQTRVTDVCERIGKYQQRILDLHQLDSDKMLSGIPSFDHENVEERISGEVRRRKAVINEERQIKIVQREKMLSEAQKCLERSMTASDGSRLIERKTRMSGLLLNFDVNMPQFINGGLNEKKRLDNLAQVYRTQAARLDEEINEMEQNIMALERDVRKSLTEAIEEMRAIMLRSKEASENTRRKIITSQVRAVEEEQKKLEACKNILISQKTEVDSQIQRIVEVVEEAKEDKARHEHELNNIKEQNLEDLYKKKREAEAAKTAFEKLLDGFEHNLNRLDVENATEYVALMNILTMLDKAVRTLPIAMECLGKSFDSVYDTFNNDMFQSRLDALPDRGKHKYLQDMTVRLQSICQVGTLVLQIPIQRLMLHDLSQAMHRPSPRELTSEPTIEEVED